MLYRELDYFEQLAALESPRRVRRPGADSEVLLGRTLIEHWEEWRPALHEAHGPGV